MADPKTDKPASLGLYDPASPKAGLNPPKSPRAPAPAAAPKTARRPMKLGRKPRLHNPLVPHLDKLLSTKTLPAPPKSVHWGSGLSANLGPMLNDELGDCTIAAYYHAIQLWSSHCNPDGLTITEPDGDVEALYSAACGYVPGDAATDQGGDEQTVLTYLSITGAPTGPQGATRHRLAAFVEVDVKKHDDIKRSIAECGLVYIGFNVPAYLMANGPPSFWRVDPKGDNSIVGGHAIVLTGYDDEGFDLISWGQAYRMGYGFFSEFTDEAYALVDYDWVDAKKMTPAGIPLRALEEAMAPLRAGAAGGASPFAPSGSDPNLVNVDGHLALRYPDGAGGLGDGADRVGLDEHGRPVSFAHPDPDPTFRQRVPGPRVDGDLAIVAVRRDPPGGVIVVLPEKLPNPVLGQPYAVQLSAKGGTGGPYQFSGTPQDGLVLGAAGSLTGVPSKIGPVTLAFQAHDGNNDSGSRSYDVEVLEKAPDGAPHPDHQSPADHAEEQRKENQRFNQRVDNDAHGQPVDLAGDRTWA